VKALFERDGFAASGDLEGQLQRIFVGFGAAVDPEDSIQP